MKKSLVLLLITLALAAYVWYFEFRKESKTLSTEEVEKVSTTLVGLQKEQISGFTIARTDGTPITIEKVQGEWMLTSPVGASTDSGAVNSILTSLEWTEKDATIEPSELTPENLGAFGLEKPAGRIGVMGPEGTREFVVGGPTIEGSRIYVRAGDDGPVYLVAGRFAENLDKTVFQLRNKNVITLVPAQIRHVRVFGASKAAVQKTGERWDLIEPFNDYADPEAVNALLKNATSLRVVTFADDEPEDLAKYGLDEPASYITVAEGAASGKSTTIEFGEKAGEGADGADLVYAKLSAGRNVFTLNAGDAADLFVALEKLQAKKVVRFDPYTLKKLTLTHGLDQIELAKPEYDWQIVKPYDALAENSAVSAIVDAFVEARVEHYVTPEPELEKYGLDSPRGSFVFVEAGEAPVSLIFGADADDSTAYAKRSNSPGVFRVSKSLLEKLAVPAIDLHTLDMQKVDMTRVDALTLARRDRTYFLKRKRGGYGQDEWDLVEPVAAPANETMMRQVTLGLATTRAEKIVAENPSDLSEYGLEEPEMKVSFGMSASGDEPRALLVGNKAEGRKRFAMLEGDNLVFTLASAFSTVLFDEPRDVSVFKFNTSEATEVEFLKGPDKYVVTKSDNEWSVTSPEGLALAEGSISGRLSRLAVLQAAKFVDFATKELARYGLEKPQAVVRVILPSGVAALSVGDMAETGHYFATSTTTDGIFLLTPGDLAFVLAPEGLFEPAEAEEDDSAAPEAGEDGDES